MATNRARDGHRPDDVALWLLQPTSCPDRCEDGWLIALAHAPAMHDRPFPTCSTRMAASAEAVVTDEYAKEELQQLGNAADRTVAEAAAYRPFAECTGDNGSCGKPARPPHTQCPSCIGWPVCRCGRRRYNPTAASVCPPCADKPALGN